MWPHPVFSCCLGWLPTTTAELSSCSVDHRPCRNWNKVLYRKSLLTLVSVHLNKLRDIHVALSPTAKFPHPRIPVFLSLYKKLLSGPTSNFLSITKPFLVLSTQDRPLPLSSNTTFFSISFVFFFFNPVISEIISVSLLNMGFRITGHILLILSTFPPKDQGII